MPMWNASSAAFAGNAPARSNSFAKVNAASVVSNKTIDCSTSSRSRAGFRVAVSGLLENQLRGAPLIALSASVPPLMCYLLMAGNYHVAAGPRRRITHNGCLKRRPALPFFVIRLRVPSAPFLILRPPHRQPRAGPRLPPSEFFATVWTRSDWQCIKVGPRVGGRQSSTGVCSGVGTCGRPAVPLAMLANDVFEMNGVIPSPRGSTWESATIFREASSHRVAKRNGRRIR